MQSVPSVEISEGDTLVIFPHEICPADGVLMEGHRMMDESYLTGEPFQITKTSSSTVISGALNGGPALAIRTTKRAANSRYAKIMEVMQESDAKRPQFQRLGDRLGAFDTPLALTVALLAWVFSGEPTRFLAVLVIATPCPLLLSIPIGIIGSISFCARRAIIVKSPVIFAFHAYPWLMRRLTYRRTNRANIHVRGYKEEGTITTPFDMPVLNDLDRFHLVMDTVDRMPRTGDKGIFLKQQLKDKLIEHKQYIDKHGQDSREVCNWRWGGPK